MKNVKGVIVLPVLCCFGLALSSCSKKEESAPPPATGNAETSMNATAADLQKSAGSAAADAQKAASSAAADAQKQVQAASSDAQKLTEQGAAAVQNQSQGLIDKAKAYIADKKYTEALDSLKNLSNLKLTADQQKVVDDLKAQIEKAMASDAASGATKAVGGLLDGKK
jgi:hypothetical protein